MGKHMVICPECGKQFDADAEACHYDPESRRYTCADCVRKADEARKALRAEPPKEPAKKLGWLPKIGICVVVLILLFAACQEIGQNRAYERAQEQAQATPEPTLDPETVEALQGIIDAYAAEYESRGMGDSVSIYYDLGNLWFSLTIPGTAKAATLAQSGNASALEKWNTLIDNSMSLSLNVDTLLRQSGIDDIKTIVVIRNDEYPEETLTAIHEGRVFWDTTGLRK